MSRQKLYAESHMDCSGPSTLVIIHWFSRCVSRELDQSRRARTHTCILRWDASIPSSNKTNGCNLAISDERSTDCLKKLSWKDGMYTNFSWNPKCSWLTKHSMYNKSGNDLSFTSLKSEFYSVPTGIFTLPTGSVILMSMWHWGRLVWLGGFWIMKKGKMT